MPHWIVTPDASGCWQVVIKLSVAGLAETTESLSQVKEISAGI